MRSDTHKVLHPIASRPLLLHLLDRVDALGADRRVIVVGKGREQVEAAIAGRDAELRIQAEQKGTGHAVQQAQAALAAMPGRCSSFTATRLSSRRNTLRRMLDRLDGEGGPGRRRARLAPGRSRQIWADRAGRRRPNRANGRVSRRERGRAGDQPVQFGHDGGSRAGICSAGWRKVGNDNAAGEYYLPDIVNVAAAEGREAVVIEGDPYEAAGVNSRAELAHLELEWQRRRREQVLEEGATLIDPESVWFAFDTTLGRDVTVEPHVVFGPGGRGRRRRPPSTPSAISTGAIIGAGARIGPFARIRPGTDLAERTKVGNFVEIKKATVAAGAKVNHLSYVGDAEVGANANIGAGTITCNYDGFGKYRTVIGEGAFIGSNSALVAPVTIGAGAIVGAGSRHHQGRRGRRLAVERGEQRGMAGWAKRFRERMTARKTG